MTLKERFDSKWTPEPYSGCWLWTKGCHSCGYGVFSVNCRNDYAHRVSWKIYRGKIPAGMCVLHHCDIPGCVNPNHLFIGTNRDNMLDKTKKHRGRMMFPKRHFVCAKITPDQVREIRHIHSLDRTRATLRMLARSFNLSYGAINGIVYRKSWKWIT
jgi:hypothetical protein